MISALLIPWLHGASSFAPPSASIRRPPSAPPTHYWHGGTTELGATLHLLTFDLDDTLFPVGPAIADANNSQLQSLIDFGYRDASNAEILAASRRIRTELRESGNVITYTALRKQSIWREIERLTAPAGETQEEFDDSVVDAVFDAWLSERHASADRNLFPHASDALGRIREDHPGAVVGAITNGRGNPLEMPSIKRYFDFCVSGEDEGVFPRRKPDRGIYEAAVEKYRECAGERGKGSGFTWIHVGDDLANDVGASAACGAKSIWLTMAKDDETIGMPSWSTATKEELERRAVMDDMAREHVSAKIHSLKELPGAIVEVLNA